CRRGRRRPFPKILLSSAHKNFGVRGRSPAKKKLTLNTIGLFRNLPNFARACGRVSIGRQRDKRPASRLGSQALLKTSDPQLEAKPAHPALRRGRGLKQRRSGLLWSCRRPKPARVTEEACPSLPAVRGGVSPIPTKAD